MSLVTLRNGAQARVLPNGQYRFVSGASNEYLDSIRTTGRRGPNKRPSSRPVGDRYLLAKLKADKGYNMRAVRADMSRSNNKRQLDPNDPSDARIIRKAGSLNRWDVRGFDDGSMKGRKAQPTMRARVPKKPVKVYSTGAVKGPRSPAQRAATARLVAMNKAKARSQRGGFFW